MKKLSKPLLWTLVLSVSFSMVVLFSSGGCAPPVEEPVVEEPVVEEPVVEEPVVEEPKDYEGVKLTVVTQPGPYIAGPLIRHRDKWTALTGGEVEVIEVPYEELYSKIMTPFITGVHAYDIIVVSATWLPDFTPYLITLDDYIANPDTNPDWDDILPAFRERLATWQGNAYALPLDGDTHSLFYRRHLFTDPENQANFKAEYGYDLQVPKTMDQLRDVAEFFTGWDWNGDGEPDYGWAQPMARGGQAHWWFWNFTSPYSIMPGPADKYHGQLYFDPETMEPLVNQPSMVKGLELYKEMAKFGPPGMEAWGVGEIRSAFPGTGNIAMTMEWGGIPKLAADPEFTIPAVMGDVGTTIRPGAMEVWDRENEKWVEFTEPNYAPVLCFGGWVGAITQTTENKDAAYDFLKFMNSPEISIQDVVLGDSGYEPYRYSHIENIQAWIDSGMTEEDALEFLAAIQADLENPNVAIDLRIPGKPEYVDDVLDLQVNRAIVGQVDPQAALDLVYEEWEKITERLGRDSQKAAYRTMMGMD